MGEFNSGSFLKMFNERGGLNHPALNVKTMIQTGNTIVYKHENGSLSFYWLCDIVPSGYVFFNWYGNIRNAASTDFWKIGFDWFNEQIQAGKIEVYESLPLDKYGDIFERQAIERNN